MRQEPKYKILQKCQNRRNDKAKRRARIKKKKYCKIKFERKRDQYLEKRKKKTKTYIDKEEKQNWENLDMLNRIQIQNAKDIKFISRLRCGNEENKYWLEKN